MTIEEMKARKIELGLTNEMVARQSGIPLSTVQKIFSGATKAPRKVTIDAIVGALARKSDFAAGPDREKNRDDRDSGSGLQGDRITYKNDKPPAQDRVKESPHDYNAVRKETGNTIDDYYALPDEQRAELIDGRFYNMEAPALVHQKILGDLYILFRECADSHNVPCEVYFAPCDVRLDMDMYTMVQPDLLVICKEYNPRAIRYEGAPDLVVEILSPSTRSKDMILKLYKYQKAGVREYWIIDPEYRTVTVHFFEDDRYHPLQYDFDSEIPVAISAGECRIDFSRIHNRLRDYYTENLV